MENARPITMQRFDWLAKKPLAQEQWETMEKTMRKTIETTRHRDRLTPFARSWGGLIHQAK
jgi:hypothetical protein